ncbi:Hsp20/alpha crystallin family protein [Halovenus marina]|uniref:Hsp20/alpha crystallin family protein n=1 Tax=Halovenus marina TaxID=3396621 RepID=UPI003F56694B
METLREAMRDLPDTVFADLLEGDDAYLIVIDMPGASAETIDARVEMGSVQIEARRDKDVPGEFRYVTEDRSLFFDITLPTPPDATGESAAASIENGVLELRLPKQSAVSGTTIPVEGG